MLNNKQSIEDFLQERGLSVENNPDEYTKRKKDFEVIMAINKFYDKRYDPYNNGFLIPEMEEMRNPESISKEANNKFLEYLKNPESVYDEFYNTENGLMNFDKKNIIQNGKPKTVNASLFDAILARDAKIYNGYDDNNYEDTEKHKELEKDINVIQNALGLDENGKFKKSSGIAETANRMFYAQQFGALGKMLESKKNQDKALEQQYVNKSKQKELTDKYQKIFDNDDALRNQHADIFYKGYVESDPDFIQYITEPGYDGWVRTDIESMLPEYYARLVLDDTSNKQKTALWFNDELQKRLNKLQPFKQQMYRGTVKNAAIGVEFIAATEGVMWALGKDPMLDGNGNIVIYTDSNGLPIDPELLKKESEDVQKGLYENDEIPEKENSVSSIITTEEGKTIFKSTIRNTFRNQMMVSPGFRYMKDIEDTGAITEKNIKERKEGYKLIDNEDDFNRYKKYLYKKVEDASKPSGYRYENIENILEDANNALGGKRRLEDLKFKQGEYYLPISTNKLQIYSMPESSDFSDQILNTSMIAEAWSNIGFTTVSMGIGSAVTLGAKGATKVTLKSVPKLLRLANVGQNMINKSEKVIRVASDIASTLGYGFFVGSYEGTIEANNAFYEALKENLDTLKSFTGNVTVNDVDELTDDEVMQLPLYESVYKKMLEENQENNNNQNNIEGNNLQISNESIPILAIDRTKEELKNAITSAFHKADDAGRNVFWGNSVINGVTNSLLKITMMPQPMQRASNATFGRLTNWGVKAKPNLDASGNLASIEYGYTPTKYIARSLRRGAGEFSEEFGQNILEQTFVARSSKSFNDYLFNHLNGDGKMNVDDYAAGTLLYTLGEAKNALTDKQSWKEGILGGFSILMPTPGVGRNIFSTQKNVNKHGNFSAFNNRLNFNVLGRREDESTFEYMRRISPVNVPMVDEIMAMKDETKNMNERGEALTDFFNSERFQKAYKAGIFTSNIGLQGNDNGFDEDKDRIAFYAKTAAYLNEIKDSEFGKNILVHYQKLIDTDFQSQNQEDSEFIQKNINEARKFNDINNLSDEEVYKTLQSNANSMMNMYKNVKESNKYVDRLFGNNADTFLKDYLSHAHLVMTELGKNKKQVEKELNDIFGKIEDSNVSETDGKIHFSDLSDEYKDYFIRYGDNISAIEERLKQEEDKRKLLNTEETKSTKSGRKALNKIDEHLNKLNSYLSFLKANDTDIFINAKDIFAIDSNLRNDFLNKKQGNKNKYNSKQSKIINDINKQANKLIKERIAEGDLINEDWFKEALLYSGNAEKYISDIQNDLKNINSDPDLYMQHAIGEAVQRGKIEGENEGKKVNDIYKSGAYLYNFMARLQPRKSDNYIERIKEQARFEEYKKALVNKEAHKEFAHIIDEYNEIKKKIGRYDKPNKYVGTFGFSPSIDNRVISTLVFRFLAKNGVNIDDYNDCISFLDSHQDELMKEINDYNNDESIKHEAPDIPYEDKIEDEYAEKEEDDGTKTQQRLSHKIEGIKTIFAREWKAAKDNGEIMNNIETKNNGVNKNQNPKPNVSEPKKDNRKIENVIFESKDIDFLKNNCGLTKEEFNLLQDSLNKYNLNENAEENRRLIRDVEDANAKYDLVRFMEDNEWDKAEENSVERNIYDKITNKLKEEKEKEKINKKKLKEEKRKRDAEKAVVDEFTFVPGRTIGLNDGNMTLRGPLFSTENIQWLKGNINNILNDKKITDKDKIYYQHVIEFYDNYILNSLDYISNLSNKNELNIYKDKNGLYIVVSKYEYGNYTINGENYQPVAVMPKIGDNSQEGNGAYGFDLYRNVVEEEGFVMSENRDSEDNLIPQVFVMDYFAGTEGKNTTEELLPVNELNGHSESKFKKEQEFIDFLRNIGITKSHAHKIMQINGNYVLVKSMLDVVIDGQNIVDLFKRKDINIENEKDVEFLKNIFSHPLFEGFFWSISDACNKLGRGNDEKVAEQLESRMELFFWPASRNNVDYRFGARIDRNNNNNLIIGLKDKNGKFVKDFTFLDNEISNNELMYEVYNLFNQALFTYDENKNLVPFRNEYGNAGLNIQVNLQNISELSNELNNSQEKTVDQLESHIRFNYNKYKYLYDNGILNVKIQRNDSKYIGMKIAQKHNSENTAVDTTNRILNDTKINDKQRATLEKIKGIQANSENTSNASRSNPDTKWATELANPNKNNNSTNQSSRHVGDELDELQREFFDYTSSIENENGRWIIRKDGNVYDIESYFPMFDKKQIYELMTSLNAIVNKHKGMIFVSRGLKLYENIEFEGQNYDVSCELDMIGIDEQGYVHVFDFKSSRFENANEEIWEKQTDIYKKALEKKDFIVKSTNIIKTKINIGKSGTGFEVGTVEKLKRSKKGKELLKIRYNFDAENESDLKNEEKIKLINKKLHTLCNSDGTINKVHLYENKDNKAYAEEKNLFEDKTLNTTPNDDTSDNRICEDGKPKQNAATNATTNGINLNELFKL